MCDIANFSGVNVADIADVRLSTAREHFWQKMCGGKLSHKTHI